MSPGDIVVCPQLRQQQLVGLADWLSALERPLPPVIVALLSGPEFVPTHLRTNAELCDVRLGADAYRVGFSRLFDVHGGGVRYLTETRDLAETFADLGAWPVELCHINSPYDTVDPLAVRSPGERIRVAYVGEAREEKGFQLLPSVVAEVLRSDLPVEFSIQVWGDLATPALAEAGRVLVRTARADDRVRVFEQVFDRDECLAFQRTGDITLLPYDATWYRDRGSALFQEAIAQGIPVVAAVGSAQGSIVAAEGNGVVFERFDSASVASAVIDAVRRYPELAAAANGARERLIVPGLGPQLDRVLATVPKELVRIEASPGPAVSVLLAVTDEPAHLAAAVSSILGQTFTDLELCILDTTPSGSAANVACSVDDGRLRYEWSPAADGSAFNALLARSRGDLLALAGAEDVWTPDKLARQLRALEDEPSADVCFHHGDPTGAVPQASGEGRRTWAGPIDFLVGNPVPETTVVFRRDIIRVVGLRTAEPLAAYRWWMQAALDRCRFLALPDSLLRYHPRPRAAAEIDEMLRDARGLIAEMRATHSVADFFPELGLCTDRAASLAYGHFELAQRLAATGQYRLALGDLERSVHALETCEAKNNLGVVRIALGGASEGRSLIAAAAEAGCQVAQSNLGALTGRQVTLNLSPWGGQRPQLARIVGKVQVPSRSRPPSAATLVALAADADIGPAIEVLRRMSADDAVLTPVLIVTESSDTTACISAAYERLGLADPPPGVAPPVEALQVRPTEHQAVVLAHLLTAAHAVLPPGGPRAERLRRLVAAGPALVGTLA
jgi:hypothetical protein